MSTNSTISAHQNFQAPTFFRRFATILYEALLVFAVLFFANYLFDTLTQSNDAMMYRHERQAWIVMTMGLYFSLCWHLKGQTLAMKTWSIKVVDHQGQLLSWKLCVLRYGLAWLSALSLIGILWMFWDKDKQFLHDRLLKTRLVMYKD